METSSQEATATTAQATAQPKDRGWLWPKVLKFLTGVAYYYNRLEVHGIENIPEKGQGALLCANHPGLLDPAYIHLPVYVERKRWMRWLGWAGLKKSNNFVIKWIVMRVESMIFVDEHEGKAKSKGESLRVMENISEELRNHHLVGLFPEGVNHQWGDHHVPYRFRTGAVRIAANNEIPIIPVALLGTHRVWPTFGEIKRPYFHMWLTIPFWFPAKVKVKFGPPFFVDSKVAENPDDIDLIRAETERLKETIYALHADLS